jgi:hypothetical protein
MSTSEVRDSAAGVAEANASVGPLAWAGVVTGAPPVAGAAAKVSTAAAAGGGDGGPKAVGLTRRPIGPFGARRRTAL